MIRQNILIRIKLVIWYLRIEHDLQQIDIEVKGEDMTIHFVFSNVFVLVKLCTDIRMIPYGIHVTRKYAESGSANLIYAV